MRLLICAALAAVLARPAESQTLTRPNPTDAGAIAGMFVACGGDRVTVARMWRNDEAAMATDFSTALQFAARYLEGLMDALSRPWPAEMCAVIVNSVRAQRGG